jgi:hypothetical protein
MIFELKTTLEIDNDELLELINLQRQDEDEVTDLNDLYDEAICKYVLNTDYIQEEIEWFDIPIENITLIAK